jgi:predicted nuclease of predicted toxin-antitoxin system
MALLLDENLAPSLIARLSDLFPGASHVRARGLAYATDEAVWALARREGLAIVTKDDDFRQRSFLVGAPPKVIWLRLGHCTTADLEAVLRSRPPEIHAFLAAPETALLVLGPPARP